jgi:ABC-2 type transport system permease protein
MGGRLSAGGMAAAQFVRVELPVFVAVLIALSGVLSLVMIISIYREGGILRRLRATPLRPQTILTAHVLVKLVLTAVTLTLTLGDVAALFVVFVICTALSAKVFRWE